MNITSITEQAEGILILVNDGYEYFIPKIQYADERDGSSEWIDHLQEKKWADKDSLYELASILSKHTKGSKIDWQQTFYTVERMFFIREIVDREPMKPSHVVDGISIYPSSEYTKKTFRMIEVGRETATEENRILMRKLVDQNLKRFHVRI
jgi:hypothetical protein